MIGPSHRAWFSGDTGKTPLFDEIGKKLGPFDVTMIESGAYHPSWGEIHLGPHQALDVHTMVRGGVMMPVHWGTFNLALHDWYEPGEVVYTEGAERGILVATPTVGHPIEPTTLKEPTAPWWRDVR